MGSQQSPKRDALEAAKAAVTKDDKEKSHFSETDFKYVVKCATDIEDEFFRSRDSYAFLNLVPLVLLLAYLSSYVKISSTTNFNYKVFKDNAYYTMWNGTDLVNATDLYEWPVLGWLQGWSTAGLPAEWSVMDFAQRATVVWFECNKTYTVIN